MAKTLPKSEKPGQKNPRLRLPWTKHLPEETVLLLILIGFAAILTVLSPYFLTFDNLVNVIMTISVTGITAIGMTYVMLSGGIDLSVGATLALSAVVAGTLAKNGAPVPVVIFAGLGIGLAIGLINGLAITRLHVPPLITTLASLSVVRGIQLIYSRAVTVYDFGDLFGVLGRGSIGPIPVPVILVAGLYLIANFVLARTPFGRKIYAVGGNERAARIVGIRVEWIKVRVYLLCGLLAAFAGLVLISRLDSAPAVIGTGLELDAIAAVVIGGTSLNGGKGGVWGTLIGVGILGLIQNALNLLNVSPYYTQLVQGVVIFLAVAIDMNRRRA
jgi:ribose/xylose/arabinose/galactoside ABC-type transport system permease subunit